MSTVFVTGGAGYIGAFACRALAAAGNSVVVYDDLSRGTLSRVAPGCTLERASLEGEEIGLALQRHRPEIVVHLAGSLGGRRGGGEIHQAQNVGGITALLQALCRAGIGRLVFISSSAVYGAPSSCPAGEDAPLMPVNHYGGSKLEAERLCAGWVRQFGGQTMVLRPSNVAGAASGLGWLEDDPTILPAAVRAAAVGVPFVLNGMRHPTDDGAAVRDFIHVVDVAEAIVRSVRHLLAGGQGDTLNVGTGVGVSLRRALTEVARVTARPLPVVEGPPVAEPAIITIDPARARRILDFAPSRSAIGTIVESAWAWYRQTLSVAS